MPLILLVVVFLLQNKPSISQTQSPRENHQTTSQDKKTPDQQQHNSYEPSTTYNVTTRKEQQDDAYKMEERRDRKMNLRLYVVYLSSLVPEWSGLGSDLYSLYKALEPPVTPPTPRILICQKWRAFPRSRRPRRMQQTYLEASLPKNPGICPKSLVTLVIYWAKA